MSKLGVGIIFIIRKYYEKKPQGQEHLDVNLEQVERQQRNSIIAEARTQTKWTGMLLFY